jgi:ribosomal protein S2
MTYVARSMIRVQSKKRGVESVDSKLTECALYLRARRYLIGNMSNFSIVVQLRRGTQPNSCEFLRKKEQIFFHFFCKIDDRHGRWKVLGPSSRSLHE